MDGHYPRAPPASIEPMIASGNIAPPALNLSSYLSKAEWTGFFELCFRGFVPTRRIHSSGSVGTRTRPSRGHRALGVGGSQSGGRLGVGDRLRREIDAGDRGLNRTSTHWRDGCNRRGGDHRN